jgi:hypothetical protein
MTTTDLTTRIAGIGTYLLAGVTPSPLWWHAA